MKIGGFNNLPDAIKAYAARKKEEAAARGETKAEIIVPGDTVEISVQAKEMKEIQDSLKDIKDIREDKVSRIKKEIENGTYKVDAGKIADGIIEEWRLDNQASAGK